MRRVGFVLAAALFVAGCAKPGNGPPQMRYGSDQCSECRMIISDVKSSGAINNSTGEVFKFDDLGCMKIFEKKNKINSAYIWGRDQVSEQWIDAHSAIFAVVGDLVTPMGFGVAAFENLRQAEQFMPDSKKELVRWQELEILKQKEG